MQDSGNSKKSPQISISITKTDALQSNISSRE